MISLDANILVYAADGNAGDRHLQASEVVQSASIARGALTEQALFEFFHVVTRKNKASHDVATAMIENLIRSFTLLLPHQTIVEDALALQARYRLSIWDARILAVCGAHGCDHLLSEDLQDGAQYGGVRIVDPFNAANTGLIGHLLS